MLARRLVDPVRLQKRIVCANQSSGTTPELGNHAGFVADSYVPQQQWLTEDRTRSEINPDSDVPAAMWRLAALVWVFAVHFGFYLFRTQVSRGSSSGCVSGRLESWRS